MLGIVIKMVGEWQNRNRRSRHSKEDLMSVRERVIDAWHNLNIYLIFIGFELKFSISIWISEINLNGW